MPRPHWSARLCTAFFFLFSCAVQAQSLDEAKQRAEAGDLKMQNELGEWYATGTHGVSTDYVQAEYWYRKAAAKNDRLAFHNVATMLMLQKRMPEALEWFNQAVERKVAPSEERMAEFYLNGEHLAKDTDRALALYTRACEHDWASACSKLGELYLIGSRVQQDPAAAIKWLHKANAMDYAWSFYFLAEAQLRGLGTPKDGAAAVKSYRKAAEGGIAPAQRQLGLVYSEGAFGEAADPEAAFNWFLKAARQGDAQAQNKIGYAYATGTGTERSYERAELWWTKAAAQGDEESKRNLEVLHERMKR